MLTRSAQPLLHLLRYAKPYQVQTWSAIANSILNTCLDLAPPYLIGIAIDVVVNEENSLIARFGITTITGQLAVLSLLTLLIWSLESLTEYFYSRLWRNLAQTLQHKLRVDAYTHLQQLELSYFEDRSSGMLLSILNDDINQLERFLNFGAHDLLRFLTTVGFVGSTFIALAPGVSWWAMLPIPFVLWGSVIFQAKLEPRYAEVREKNGLISSRLANNLSGMATIKSFTAEDYERDRVTDDSEAYRRSNSKAIALSAAFVPLIRIIILLGFTATLFLGGIAVADGRLSAGTYGFLVFIIQRLLWPFTELGEIMDEYQRAMASVQRVMHLLETPTTIASGTLALLPAKVKGQVQFKAITFAYRDRQPVLKQLSLIVPAGATIGIVGATGAGKSTLAKLLLRFYEPQQGQILIDGLGIRDLKLFDLEPIPLMII
jgi:ATP-binding cassette, subfamily B, bacterial